MNKDWHPADILAALKKNGWNWTSLSAFHGYATRGALRRVIETKWPKGEEIVAEAIGVPPETIWPSRYVDTFRRAVVKREVKRFRAA